MDTFDIGSLAGGADAIFAIARSQPRFTAKLDRDKAMHYLVEIGSHLAANQIQTAAKAIVDELASDHEAAYGARPTPDDKDGLEFWDEALDDAIGEKFEPFIPVVGHNWHGDVAVDSQAHNPDQREKIALTFSKAYVEGILSNTDDQATHKKSMPKRLSKLGIGGDALDAFIASLGKPASPEVRAKTLTDATETVHAVVQAYSAANNGDVDLAVFMELLDGVADSDDILAMSALATLDPRAEPVATVAAFRQLKAASGTFADDVTMMLYLDTPPQPAAPTEKEAAKAAKKDRAPKEARPGKKPLGEVAIPSTVLAAISELGGTDREMAELFGVQRPVYNRAKNGEIELLVSKDALDRARYWIEQKHARADDLLMQLPSTEG